MSDNKSKSEKDNDRLFSTRDLHLAKNDTENEKDNDSVFEDQDLLNRDTIYEDYGSFDNSDDLSYESEEQNLDEMYGVRHRRKKKKKHIALFVVIAVIVVILVVLVIVGMSAKSKVSSLKSSAYELADQLGATFECVKNLDPDGAEAAIDRAEELVDYMRETMDDPLVQLGAKVPALGDDVLQVDDVLDIVDDAADDIVKPLVQKLRDEPLSGLKKKKGFNVKLINSYLGFLEEIVPELEDTAERLSEVHISLDEDGVIENYAEKFNSAIDQYYTISEYIPLIKEILGDGSDRTYLLVAQNSAEIRASGGFPGSVGTIKISDGYLKVGDFNGVLSMFDPPNGADAGIDANEEALFGYMYATWAHDACYNPHFGRVAEIWQAAYYRMHGEMVDGIIAMTPVIIQKLLGTMGGLTLSDGSFITGENATRILQHDFYYKYLQTDVYSEESVISNDKVDGLFSETAAKVLSHLMDNFSPSNILEYFQILSDGAADRTIIVWLDWPSGEAECKALNISGDLNSDPDQPVTGVYFDFSDPCKLGWFMDIDTELGDPYAKADGSIAYPVTVTLNNAITSKEMNAGNYITGTYGGSIEGYVYFFAPAGGTIDDFVSSDGMTFEYGEYQDLEVAYNKNIMLESESPVTITYTVTTAPGVKTPLKIETTPTLQAYR